MTFGCRFSDALAWRHTKRAEERFIGLELIEGCS